MKRSSVVSVLFLLALGYLAHAQSYQSIGQFYNAPTKVWFDSSAHRLYVAGGYSWFDSTETHGFGYVVGDTLIPLGCGFGMHGTALCNASTGIHSVIDGSSGFVTFQGELYVTGLMSFAGGNYVNRIAKWQGNDWVAVGSGINGHGNGMKVFGSELYVFGMFDSINGIAANGLAKYDGHNWSPVFNLPPLVSGLDYNNIEDIEWFHGELYIVGNFWSQGTNPPIRDIAKWNGANWVAVEMGIYGSLGYLKRLANFRDKLVIAGCFNSNNNPNSIPGTNITTWDGVRWDTMGGGLRGMQSLDGVVSDIVVHDDALYAVGGFEIAGDIFAKNIAKWDGTKWCGTTDQVGNYPSSIAFLGDTLFMTGSFHEINGDSSLKYLVKWVGMEFGNTCEVNGTDEVMPPNNEAALFPNPTTNAFSITLPQNVTSTQIQIRDAQGRAVAPPQAYTGTPVDVSALARGLYFVEVSWRGGRCVLKLLKE